MNLPDNLGLYPHYVEAKDGEDFYRLLAVYAFEMFIRQEEGAVIIREPYFHKHPDGRVMAKMEYLRKKDAAKFASGELGEIPEMLESYDPDNELILITLDNQNNGTPIILKGGELGKGPHEHYKESLKGKAIQQWRPGTVLRLNEQAEDVEPGYYIFLREANAIMQLCRAGENEDGDICETNDLHEIHVDYADLFEVMIDLDAIN